MRLAWRRRPAAARRTRGGSARPAGRIVDQPDPLHVHRTTPTNGAASRHRCRTRPWATSTNGRRRNAPVGRPTRPDTTASTATSSCGKMTEVRGAGHQRQITWRHAHPAAAADHLAGDHPQPLRRHTGIAGAVAATTSRPLHRRRHRARLRRRHQHHHVQRRQHPHRRSVRVTPGRRRRSPCRRPRRTAPPTAPAAATSACVRRNGRPHAGTTATSPSRCATDAKPDRVAGHRHVVQVAGRRADRHTSPAATHPTGRPRPASPDPTPAAAAASASADRRHPAGALHAGHTDRPSRHRTNASRSAAAHCATCAASAGGAASTVDNAPSSPTLDDDHHDRHLAGAVDRHGHHLVAHLHRRREPARTNHRAHLPPTLRQRRRRHHQRRRQHVARRQIGRRHPPRTGRCPPGRSGRPRHRRRPSSSTTPHGGIGVPASTVGRHHQHLGPVGGLREAPHHQHRRRQHQRRRQRPATAAAPAAADAGPLHLLIGAVVERVRRSVILRSLLPV